MGIFLNKVLSNNYKKIIENIKYVGNKINHTNTRTCKIKIGRYTVNNPDKDGSMLES